LLFFEEDVMRSSLLIPAVFLLFLLNINNLYAAEGASGQGLSEAGAKDIPELIKLVKGSDPLRRSQAQYALIRMGEKPVPELIKALGERENLPEIIYVLNSIKDARAAGPLAGLLDVSDQETLEKVKAALFSLGEQSVPYLFEALGDPARCEQAAKVLAALREPGYFPTLVCRLRDDDPARRKCAAVIERAWLDEGAAAAMGELLRDSRADIRREASGYFLALSPNIGTVPGLSGLFSDTDDLVRINAVKIAAKNRETGLFTELCRVMSNDINPEARRLAGDAVFKCNPDKAAPALISALKDEDDAVAGSAACHLGELKAKDALLPLQGLLTGRGQRPSDTVVEGVARALADIGGGYDPNIFLPYINWENLYVVRSVIRAWEGTARPSDGRIKEALSNYMQMEVDGRYKDRVKALLDRL